MIHSDHALAHPFSTTTFSPSNQFDRAVIQNLILGIFKYMMR